MRRPLYGLLVGLKAILHLMQKLRHGAAVRLVSHSIEFGCQLPKTLAGPSQGRFRIAAGGWFYEHFHISLQGGVFFYRLLSASTFSSNSPPREAFRLPEFPYPFRNRSA